MTGGRPNDLKTDFAALIADAREQVQQIESPERVKPDFIRGYELIREIHRGGQGVVYLAHQRATSRDVAIKVLREGPFAGPGDRARFEREVQILASLNHPNIVAIHDSGIASGSFYFVMDYIGGLPLDEWADAQRLGQQDANDKVNGANARRIQQSKLLPALIKICDALNVAHQRGVIHRDLKPSNIRINQNGEPFVLDFGLAKLASGDAETVNTTMLTATGQFLGTLPWASPEQVEHASYHADIRSDVYALGLMLYRSLTGRMPYASAPTMAELIRVITEVEPPSMRSLLDPVDTDLETIVRKCLNKLPDRRYQTAGEVAADLQRYLHGEPISARRDSGWYLLRMFARRHRMAVGGAAVFAATLVTASIMLTYLYARAKANERLAIHREHQVRQVAQFQASQLAEIDPESMGMQLRQKILDGLKRAADSSAIEDADSSAMTARLEVVEQNLAGVNFTNVALDVLDKNILSQTRRAIDDRFDEQPLVQAELLQTLATTLSSLGLLEQALEPQIAALEIRERILGNQHLETLNSHSKLGDLLLALGRNEEAETHLQHALATSQRVFGETHPTTLTSMNNMGSLLQAQGQFEEARKLFGRALTQQRQQMGDEHPETLRTIDNMGSVLSVLGQLDEAVVYFQESLQTRRRVSGSDDRLAIESLANLGDALLEMEKFDEALAAHQEVLDIRRRALGDTHPQTLSSLNSLGSIYYQMGKSNEALRCYDEALQTMRRTLGDAHPSTLGTMNNLAALHRSMGHLEESLRFFREALQTRRHVLGDAHPSTLNSIDNLAGILAEMGQLEESRQLRGEALSGYRHVLGDEHPNTLRSLNGMTQLLISLGRYDDAMPLAKEALDSHQRLLGPDHTETMIALNNMADLLRSQGQVDQAIPHCRTLVETARRVLGADHPKAITAAANLGVLLKNVGHLEEAMPYHREALDRYQRVLGDQHPNTLSAKLNMGSLLKAMGRREDAMPYYQDACDGYRQTLGDDHPHTLNAVMGIGSLLKEMGRPDEAMPYYEEALAGFRRGLGHEHWFTLRAVNLIGELLVARGQLDEATPYFQESLDTCRRVLGDGHPETIRSLNNMGNLLQRLGKFEEAEPLLLEAGERTEELPALHELCEQVRQNLSSFYEAWHQQNPAAGHLAAAEKWRAKLSQPTSDLHVVVDESAATEQ